MYRCQVCDQVSRPKEPRRLWPLKRPDGSIREEVTVCISCLKGLERGDLTYPPQEETELTTVLSRPRTVAELVAMCRRETKIERT